ncbi:MAG: type II secretion system F family protein [Armatimonadetes bacterium]|nr:type II secretion system F family protein [Armatimonadota bacterium]
MVNDNGVGGESTNLVQMFSQRFAELIESGQSLVWSLFQIEHEQQDPQLKRIVRNVRMDIELGAHLSAAMAKHAEFFDDRYIAEVVRGEQEDLRTAFRKLASV